MTKNQALAHWVALEPNQNPLNHMTPIAYKTEGSTFGTCGIRIDGNPNFIDDCLSCLMPLIKGENVKTRLGLNRNKVTPKEINGKTKIYKNADEQAEYCYIRLHERGEQAQIMKGLFNLPPITV